MNNDEIRKLQEAIDAVGEYGSISAAAKALNIPRRTLGGRYQKAINLSYKPGQDLSPGQRIAVDSATKKIVQDKKGIENKYNELLKQLDLERNKNQLIDQFKNKLNNTNYDNIEIVKHTPTSESTALIVVSDLHYEETIEAAKVDFLNEYNIEIATKRFKKLFQNALRLVEINRSGTTIKQCILFLLGDLITGTIHPELLENNQLSPIQSCINVYKLCVEGINFLVENGGFEKIIVMCNVGNHARTTEKIRISTEVENSYEFLIYNFLASYYEKNEVVQFKIAQGYFNYINVYEKFLLRAHHGHSIRYAGGVGGVTIPVNKAIANWNQGRQAYLDIFGHWHTSMSGKNFIVNGSIIGYSPFSQFMKFPYEDPQQRFVLINSKWGRTIESPIFLKD